MRMDLHGTGVGVSGVFPGFIREAGIFADAQVQLPAGRRDPLAARTSPTP